MLFFDIMSIFLFFLFFLQIIPEVSLNPVVDLGSYPNTELYPPQVDLQLLWCIAVFMSLQLNFIMHLKNTTKFTQSLEQKSGNAGMFGLIRITASLTGGSLCRGQMVFSSLLPPFSHPIQQAERVTHWGKVIYGLNCLLEAYLSLHNG